MYCEPSWFLARPIIKMHTNISGSFYLSEELQYSKNCYQFSVFPKFFTPFQKQFYNKVENLALNLYKSGLNEENGSPKVFFRGNIGVITRGKSNHNL